MKKMQTIANVSFVRPELAKLLKYYYLIRDCISGEPTVKDAKTKYLPMPDEINKNEENKARYAAYLLRAVFYNVTRRTLIGLVGQVFMRDPEIKVPALLQPVVDDATGSGVDITQLSKKALSNTLAYSRSGIFVDYPESPEGATIEQLNAGNIRPTISIFSPHEIINWRVTKRGAKEILSLIVLYENHCGFDDGFEMKLSPQFRVLRLTKEGFYQQEIWREEIPTQFNESAIPKNLNLSIFNSFFPKDANGNLFTEIPFSFIGSENNDSNPDNPNMYDLASINLAHYRNSADYEECCFIMGQPTLGISGLTEDWVTNVLGGTIAFGSRGGIPLPVGGSLSLVQAGENTMIKEAMETKERQMVALGAKLVEQKQVQRTAFETKVEATSEGSILSSTAKNVQSAFKWALEWCCLFVGIPQEGIEFKLNTDFDIARMTPDEQRQVIADWQAGAITFEEMRSGLRKAGVATVDDAIAKADIAKDAQEAVDLEIQKAKALQPAIMPNQN